MQFMLEEYKDVKIGKVFVKQAGQIEIKKTDDDRYKVKVYGMEVVADIIFKTPEEAVYFASTWKKLKKKENFPEDLQELADTVRDCEYENRDFVREQNIKKNKKVSLIKRFKKWLIKKLEQGVE